MIFRAITLLLALTLPANAFDLPPGDVYFIGEMHDNSVHHHVQAEFIESLKPGAVVFEMIPDGTVHEVSESDNLALLGEKLDWWGRAASDIELYMPIFQVTQGLPL